MSQRLTELSKALDRVNQAKQCINDIKDLLYKKSDLTKEFEKHCDVQDSYPHFNTVIHQIDYLRGYIYEQIGHAYELANKEES